MVDENGVPFIQEICNKALKLEYGQIDEQRYPWKNAGDARAREKVTRFTYFPKWDWIIGAGSYVEEFYRAEEELSQIGQSGRNALMTVALLSSLAGAIAWFVLARYLTRRLQQISTGIGHGAKLVDQASAEVAASGMTLAEGSTEQVRPVLVERRVRDGLWRTSARRNAKELPSVVADGAVEHEPVVWRPRPLARAVAADVRELRDTGLPGPHAPHRHAGRVDPDLDVHGRMREAGRHRDQESAGCSLPFRATRLVAPPAPKPLPVIVTGTPSPAPAGK